MNILIAMPTKKGKERVQRKLKKIIETSIKGQ